MTSTPAQHDALTIYLNDHLAAMTGTVELAKRAAASDQGSLLGPPLATLAGDLEADRGALVDLMARLDVGVTAYKVAAGWAAEKVGRLKLNGSWVSRSPLAPVVETEGLRLGIEHSACAWRTLLSLGDERLDTTEIERLATRSKNQVAVVERLRRQAAGTALGGTA